MTTTRDWMRQAQQRQADAVRVATRNAPSWVRRGIDRDRVRQGLAPVWQVEHRAAETDASGWVVLVGACCPGRSMPVTAATDGLHIPEIVDPHAFDHSVRAIQAGRHHVDLEEGHGGPVIATTRDGTLTFTSSEGTGLMAVARVKVGLHRSVMLAAGVAGDLALSVSMLPKRIEIVKRDGRQVRVVREVELKALACLWSRFDHGKPAYPAARMWLAFESDKRAVKRAMRQAAEHAREAMTKAGRL